MGASASKNNSVSTKDREESAGRVQKAQFDYNFWPEPIRKEGTTHSSDENEMLAPGAATEYVGSSTSQNTKDHKFDTMVAAMNNDEAPSAARLFVYGDARYGDSPETRIEIACLKLNTDGKAVSEIRYTDYFTSDAEKLVNSSSLTNPGQQDAAKLRAKLTSAPTEPNDDDRKARMEKALNELISNWKDSEESALKSRFSKLPWKRKCAGDKLEKAVAKVCSPDCTITMPLQQMVIPAKDLASEWRARLQGKGPFVHFGQTEISLTNEAYAGHHPTGFAQFVVYSCDSETTGQHHLSNGILVAEFDNKGKAIEKLVMFRDFISESERDSILVK